MESAFASGAINGTAVLSHPLRKSGDKLAR
jgi:hypothetical protein